VAYHIEIIGDPRLKSNSAAVTIAAAGPPPDSLKLVNFSRYSDLISPDRGGPLGTFLGPS
jgi:hypothetical protein